jgi:Lantibiotic dehydratase, N terminus
MSSDSPTPQATSLPGHLVPLPGGDFSVWKWVCLRSAGFPAAACDDIAAPAAATAADRVLDASENERADEEAAFLATLDIESRAVRSRLQERFAGRDIQLALRWQSPSVLDGSIGWLLRQSPDVSNRKMREAERLAARFLQRYSLKNDSIGHFGPLGWGTFDPRPGTTSVVPGKSLLARRFVRLEAWCVDALLGAAAPDPGAERYLRPRRLPFWYLDGSRAVFPARAALAARLGADTELGAVPVDGDLLPVLELCDGLRRPVDIASEFAGAPVSDGDLAATLDALWRLRAQGLIAFAPEIPLVLHPERALSALLEDIQDAAARARLETWVSPVLTAFDEVSRAGEPDELAEALGALEQNFASATALDPRRSAGRAYAGRTLVHMDAVRDVDLRLGAEVLVALGPPLSLVLRSARWLSFTLAEKLGPALTRIHDRLASGDGAVAFQTFANEALPIVVDDSLGIHRAAVAELQRRWEGILHPDRESNHQQFRVDEIASAVADAFPAPYPGWQLARYMSPDVLLAAKDAAAVARGDLVLVLGEVHLYNTVSRGFFIESHPDPEAMFRARDLDIPAVCVLPVPSKRFNLPRIAVGLGSARDFWFAYEDAPSAVSPDRLVVLGELVVEVENGVLVARTRDRRFSCRAIEFLAHTVANTAMSFPSLVPPSTHTPRLTFDGLVVQRETWRLAAEEVEAPRRQGDAAPTRAARFLAGRRLQRRLGMPRRVFVRAAGEKPVCIDFESPALADILGHLAAGSPGELLDASELIPDLDQLWLVDADGSRYTSELRLVVLDPAAPPA